MSTCPKCSTLSRPGMAACRVCGTFLLEEGNTSGHSSRSTGDVPWENIAESGVFRALTETVLLSLLKPAQFFRRLPRSKNVYMAWLFALIVGSTGMMFSYFWGNVFTSTALQAFENLGLELERGASAATALVAAPVIVSANVVLLSVYCHVILLVLGLKKHPFSSTFKVICYAQSAALWTALPLAGSFVSSVWTLYLVISGLANVHRLSRIRALILLALPLLLIVMLLALLVAVAVAGLLAGGFSKDILDILR